MDKTNVVLVGFACSGKSTVGKLLAVKLHKNFVDVDEQIRLTYPEAWNRFCTCGDEAAFRAAECDTVAHLSCCNNAVISCGGGTPLSDNFAALADNSVVVWLDVLPQTVRKRLGNEPRPLFDNLNDTELADFVAARKPVYRKFVDVTLSADNLSPDSLADKIVELLQKK